MCNVHDRCGMCHRLVTSGATFNFKNRRCAMEYIHIGNVTVDWYGNMLTWWPDWWWGYESFDQNSTNDNIHNRDNSSMLLFFTRTMIKMHITNRNSMSNVVIILKNNSRLQREHLIALAPAPGVSRLQSLNSQAEPIIHEYSLRAKKQWLLHHRVE